MAFGTVSTSFEGHDRNMDRLPENESVEELTSSDEAEDMADIEAARAARAEMAESGEAPIPWDEVKSKLGLT